MKKIYIFDTTLRDGEQVPGAKLNLQEKIQVAKELVKLKVDIMEVGFPSSSKGDFEAVKTISQVVGKDTMVTALGRAVRSDIDAVYESIKGAENPMIHIVLGSSNVHMSKKFHKTPEEVLQMGVGAVRYAKSLTPQVQYSLEDASRSDFEYIWKTIEAVVKAGATMINVPDTVGYAVPEEFGRLIYRINDRLKNLNPEVLLSVHCHNDTGLATANALAAVRNGADKIECTINGIGERAGNTALEEVVMGIKLHPEYYGGYTDIEVGALYEASRKISSIMGIDVQVNKAITGENAFAHSSGIHQDGLLKSKDVYEIISPETIGAHPMELVLTARSGKHAFEYISNKLGYEIQEEAKAKVYESFLQMADQKKEVYDSDIVTLMKQFKEVKRMNEIPMWQLIDFQVVMNSTMPTATIKLMKDEEVTVSKVGEGAIEALYGAIVEAVRKPIKLMDYRIHSLGNGKESMGKVSVQIECEGTTYQGKAVERDIIRASAIALINGINKIEIES